MYLSRTDGRLSWPGWLVYVVPRWFFLSADVTHLSINQAQRGLKHMLLERPTHLLLNLVHYPHLAKVLVKTFCDFYQFTIACKNPNGNLAPIHCFLSWQLARTKRCQKAKVIR